MSYSSKIKYNIYKIKKKYCCRLLELYGFLLACGAFANESHMKIAIKNKDFFDYYISLLKSICVVSIGEKYLEQRGKSDITYLLNITDSNIVFKVKNILGYPDNIEKYESFIKSLKPCCIHSFLRGAFIGTGFLADPSKTYKLEIIVKEPDAVDVLLCAFNTINVYPKLGKRKGYEFIYLNIAENIGDFLGNIDAKQNAFEYANTEIEKTILNSVNRVMNCENANINKLVNSAEKQKEAILKLRNNGYKNISQPLIEIAELRLENMDASIEQLGSMNEPQLSKSGVAHRLKKIIELSEQI